MTKTLISIFITIHYLFSSLYPNEGESINRIISKTERKFRLVNDYEVKMAISMSIPAFRMPKKKYHIFFKQPNKIKIKSRGFGVLPRTGMFTSPIENFDNLTDLKINNKYQQLHKDRIVISGNLILDSLELEMPNDYAKLTFKPTVDVVIDTLNWVIKRVTTKIDTVKIMEIENEFDFVDKDFYLPIESKVEYYVKDARLTKWMKKDIGLFIGDQKNIKGDMVKGQIKVLYNNYKVNRGLEDSIF